MSRNRAFYYLQRKRTIRKKIQLLKRIGGLESVRAWTRGQPGRLVKGKIHCSCWMCRTKSSDQITHRDAKHNVSAAQQMLDWGSRIKGLYSTS